MLSFRWYVIYKIGVKLGWFYGGWNGFMAFQFISIEKTDLAYEQIELKLFIKNSEIQSIKPCVYGTFIQISTVHCVNHGCDER